MMSLRLPAALAAIAGVVSFAATASAQVTVDVQTPPPPQGQVLVTTPGPVYAQPQPVYAQPVYGQPQAVYVQPAYPPPVYEDHGRFRFGVDVGGGFLVAGGSGIGAAGPAINFGLRLGYQINNPFAVYAQFNLPIGFGTGTTPAGDAVAGVAVAETNAVMFEYTWRDLLHFGLGPSIDAVVGALCANDGSVCAGGTGIALGANGRVAVTLGPHRPGRRSGLSIGLDLHPIFAGGVFFFGTANIGYELD